MVATAAHRTSRDGGDVELHGLALLIDDLDEPLIVVHQFARELNRALAHRRRSATLFDCTSACNQAPPHHLQQKQTAPPAAATHSPTTPFVTVIVIVSVSLELNALSTIS